MCTGQYRAPTPRRVFASVDKKMLQNLWSDRTVFAGPNRTFVQRAEKLLAFLVYRLAADERSKTGGSCSLTLRAPAFRDLPGGDSVNLGHPTRSRSASAQRLLSRASRRFTKDLSNPE